MFKRNFAILMIVLIAALALSFGTAMAKDKDDQEQDPEAKAKGDLAELESKVPGYVSRVQKFKENFARELSERDRLMLQQRFVAGKEFYFMLEDYRGAANIFWGVVLHPEAVKFNKYYEAVYYLAESLFQLGYYYDAKVQFERLLALGQEGTYFTLSLYRLIEISIAQGNFPEAERLYTRLLAEKPEGVDASFGQYLIGKSYFLRGDPTKAFQVLESIPKETNYYPVAQYYMAAVEVRDRKYQAALDRLRRLTPAFAQDFEHKDEVVDLTRLSLGRLFYETNDFPQALNNYFKVPSKSDHYAEALYESMWVNTTRNDFLLKAIEDESQNFSSVNNDYTFLNRSIDKEDDKEASAPLLVDTEKMEPDLSEMKGMFDKIDDELGKLQKDAMDTFNKLVDEAPGSPLLPEAELLMGGIYNQVQNYEDADRWYKNLHAKYSRLAVKVRAAQERFNNDQTALSALQAGATPSDQPLADTSSLGIPPEIAYWLHADKDVQKAFKLYAMVQEERQNIAFMRDLLTKIEAELRKLESGAGFPLLKEGHRKVQMLRDEAYEIESKINVFASELSNFTDPEEKNQAAAQLPAFRNQIQTMVSELNALESKMDAKQSEKIAAYRQELRSYAAPLGNYAMEVQRIYAEAADMSATAARAELRDIDAKVHEYILQAKLGVVDTAWKATQGTGDEIKDLQWQMEDEVRKFRRQLRGVEIPTSTDQGSSDK